MSVSGDDGVTIVTLVSALAGRIVGIAYQFSGFCVGVAIAPEMAGRWCALGARGVWRYGGAGGVGWCIGGHVVLFRQSWNMRTIGAHEFAHVRQYMRWGFLFPLAYGLESVWQWLRGRHYYWDNRFEVEAYRLGREPFARVAKKSLSNRRNDA